MPTGSHTATAPGRADDLLNVALAEDLGSAGDITTCLTLGGRGPVAQARIVAKASGCLSGVDLACRAFQLVDADVTCRAQRRDGDRVEPGDLVLEVRGAAASLLEGERTALNVLCRLSGVATMTRRFVDRVAGTSAAIVDTRKTTPGWRMLEKQAVLHGGGKNHRIGLFDEVLLKENHFAMARDEGHAALVARVKAAAPGTRLTAEARDLDEARAVADGGADAILLDNFDVAGLRGAVAALATHPRRREFELEASGGVTLDSVVSIAATGVERISVGALTHSAPALDLSLLLDVPEQR